MPAPSLPALVTRWRSYLDVSGDAQESSWEEVFAWLSTPAPFRGDTEHPGWSPARCQPPTRRDEHVTALAALVLDYDGTAAIEGARDLWALFFGLIHTTRKHSEAVHRFRVVLPLSRYVTPAEHALLWSWANARAARAQHRIDSSTRNPSRFWYTPGVQEGGPFEAHRLTGSPVDVDRVLAELARQREPPPVAAVPRETSIVVRIRRASHYLAKMDPAIAGQAGHLQTWKAAMVLTQGFDLPDDVAADLLTREYNPRCQPPWSKRQIDHKIASASRDSRVPRGYLLGESTQADWHARLDPPPLTPEDDDIERAAIQVQDGAPVARRSVFVKLGTADIFSPLPPVPWLVQGLDLTPGAPAMFAGYGYSRKTIAAQSLALSIAAGRRIWGEFTCRRGRVLHLDYEQGNRLSRERYQRLAAGMGLTAKDVEGQLDLVVLPSLYLDSPTAADVFAREFEGYDLVIVDSFRAAAPSADENASDVRRHLDVLTRASEQTGALPIVVHHARKPSKEQGGDARMALRGSSGIFDACSSVLVFSAEKGKPTLVQHEKARTSGVLAEDFCLDTEDLTGDDGARAGLLVNYMTTRQVETKATPRPSRFEQLKAAILLCVRTEGDVRSMNAICAKVAGGNKSDKLEAIRELLHERKLVELGTGGPYRATG